MEIEKARPLLIVGSNRKNSDTLAFAEKALNGIEYQVLDLLDYPVAPYNYEHQYPENDAFARLTSLLLRHQVLVLASPVYWYSMSGLMKTFFDRLTDLIRDKKTLGRQLRGKDVFVLAAGNNPELPPGFLVPFELSCHYLGMQFRGSLYHSAERPEPTADAKNEVAEFRRKLLKCTDSSARANTSRENSAQENT